jgi:hypothetical protein
VAHCSRDADIRPYGATERKAMMPECEAEERIMQALYEIENMAGSWIIDLGKIKQILTGSECNH